MNGRFVSVHGVVAPTRRPAAAAPLAAQAAAEFSHVLYHVLHASPWAARGRGHRTTAAQTKAHAAGLIPGLCTRGLASACARGADVSLPPSPPKLIPSPARAGSSRPPRRKHTRRPLAIPVRVAPRACRCAVLGCIARAPTSRFWVENPAWKHRKKMSFFLAQSTF